MPRPSVAQLAFPLAAAAVALALAGSLFRRLGDQMTDYV